MITNSHYIDWERCKDIFTDEIDFLPGDNQFVHISMDYNNEWIYIPKGYKNDTRTITETYGHLHNRKAGVFIFLSKACRQEV